MAAEEGMDLPETGADPRGNDQGTGTARRTARIRRKPRQGTGLGGRLFVLALAFGLVVLGFELSGKPMRLPVFLVAEIENRLNASLADVLPDTTLSVGAIEVVVGGDWVPHLGLEDLTLTKTGGPVLLTLPDTQLTIDPKPLLSGQIRARSLRISGAAVVLRRDAEGRFDFAFGAGQGPKIDSLGALFAALDKSFESPVLAGFRTLEADALSLTFADQISGRSWVLGDGHFVFENRDRELATALSMSLVGSDGVAAEADVTAVAEKGRGAARITATVDHVAAKDLAAQTPVLGFLAALDAPISGQIIATLDRRGVQGMQGRLDIGTGAVRPSSQAQPLAFDHASLSIGYSPQDGRVVLSEVAVESRSLRLAAQGQAYLVDGTGAILTGPLDGRRPASFLGQLTFDRVLVDPEGLFAAPVEFSNGALELRLSLAPFRLDLGQFSLAEGDQRFVMSGKVVALADGRVQTALDLAVNTISRDRLLALWPPRLVTPTRNWIVDNLTDATLSGIHGALRQVTGEAARLELDYGFHNARFKFMKQMPPVERADGYATIQGKVYTLAMDRGVVNAPQGGVLDVAGSVLQVPDIFAKPATGDFRIRSRGSLTATLSILDQPPFEFLTKAGRPVNLGQGMVETVARLSLPLIGKVMPGDVTYLTRATISGFRSDKIVRGKVVTADRLAVEATPDGMTITGPGRVGAVPVNVTYSQGFRPGAGPPVVEGTVELSPVALKEFSISLPDGAVKGLGQGKLRIVMPKGAVPVLNLTSDVKGLSLALPEIGWSKPAAATGQLEATVELDSPPRVPHLSLQAAGLAAEGEVSLTPDGGLEVMHLPKVRLAHWFDGAVDLNGRGAGKPPAVDVLSGRFDLRHFPEDRGSGKGGASGPLTVRLDKLQVTDSIALTGFRGNFGLTGGFNGEFTGLVNGQDAAAVAGEVAPAPNGTAVHVTSANVGAVARATGIFTSAHGGSLDMQLVPRRDGDSYDGTARIRSVRVRYGNVLADLLNAISVVGLLEQLNGPGIAFDQADATFVLTPTAVMIEKGSAIGASMGISLSGLYRADTSQLDMQGVLSPIYLLNGIGAFLTRKGEGLFGFNYTLKGPADDPQVAVNPLSILTPGMFREIFRRPAPVLPSDTGTSP